MAGISVARHALIEVNSPDVSVVVPTYNRAALLPRALRSLFSQRGERLNFEIIVVDNNSTDETGEVVESLKTNSPVALRSVRETRQGNAYARNAGIENAAGAIIAFLDDGPVCERKGHVCPCPYFDQALSRSSCLATQSCANLAGSCRSTCNA